MQQEALIAVWRAAGRYRSGGGSGASFKTYAYRRALGAAFDWMNNRSQGQRWSERELYSWADGLARMDNNLEQVEFDNFLSYLPRQSSQVLKLRYVQGMTFPEIGSVLGLTMNGAWYRVQVALGAAEELLNGSY